MTPLERLKSITNWIGELFAKIPSEIKQYAREAHKITTAIKEALDSDLANALVGIIPGDWDDSLKASAIALISELSAIFQKIEGQSEETTKAAKNAILAKMASKLIALQDGNDLPENRYDTYQQLSYSAEVKKTA